jgi:ABC-type nitrate/sulfonate/bicarbonate transport system substrate-binding protein
MLGALAVPISAMVAPLLAGVVTSGTAGASTPPTTVTLALDWTPNTNHTGIFAAQSLGYYKAAGIKLKIIPYGSTAVETLLSDDKADFGVSYEDGLTLAKAAGGDLQGVFIILQKPDAVIGVAANNTKVKSPKDLDGTTYAGFGASYEEPYLQTVIRHAGGTGNFTTISLGTSAYDAVWSGQATFDIPEPTWEVIEGKLLGKPFKTFDPYQYGAPKSYSELLAASSQFLEQNPGLSKKFVEATQKGYEWAAANPVKAAKILIADNKSALSGNVKLVDLSQDLESKQYYLDSGGVAGFSNPAEWQNYTNFYLQNGILTDATGNKLTAAQAPTPAQLFTSRYLSTTDPFDHRTEATTSTTTTTATTAPAD